jgi:hypothetical protein
MPEAATVHVHWLNGTHGRLQPSARVFPAYLGESTKLREVSPMTLPQRSSSTTRWGQHCPPPRDWSALPSAGK